MGRKTIQRGAGKRHIAGKDFQLAEEIRYIQRRAAEYDGRWVTVGPLALFSTETGDAWLLDPADYLAVCVARDGDPEPVHLEGPIGISPSNGRAATASMVNSFVYTGRTSARIVSIFGYPTERIAALG